MKKLEIIDLHVEVEGREILKGINLTIHPGKIHTIMGPNGSGKTTLANTLMGHPRYKITKGKIILDGIDITKKPTNERAKLGLFLSFQHPHEIPGLNITNFLRTAVNNNSEKPYSVIDFYNLLKQQMSELNIDPAFAKRNLNEGFSGGEKKRMEILQLVLLQPKYAVLDETDSGADVDAIKIISKAITNQVKKNLGVMLITHYNKIFNYIKPDEVSILMHGKIIKQGGYELAQIIEKDGFENLK
ncbi:Fe-S cluster assembly ATPase SufC [Candidatus Woesearchaeota archaeon]|nr:Fe-S cluster assembly ATPase SufC [Candidatus Woesearchaeota archaeon]